MFRGAVSFPDWVQRWIEDLFDTVHASWPPNNTEELSFQNSNAAVTDFFFQCGRHGEFFVTAAFELVLQKVFP